MGADNNVSSVSLLLPNLGVLLLVAAGLLADKIPLISGRPPADDDASSISETTSRLWQDPLGIKEPAKLDPAKRPPLEEVFSAALVAKQRAYDQAHAQRRTRLDNGYPKPRVLILPVLLTGAPYAADKETRLRIRYAVHSALGRAQYVPEDPEHLKFAKVAMKDGPDEVVRFEDFHVRYLVTDDVHMPGHENYVSYAPPKKFTDALTIQNAYDWVIVLWLDEDHLAERAAKQKCRSSVPNQIDQLMAQLTGGTQPSEFAQWDLKIIGPTSSDQLVDMIDPDVPFDPQFSAEVLSPRATAAKEALQISNTRTTDPNTINTRVVHGRTDDKRWTIRRLIATDDRLRNAILRELKLRGVYPDKLHPMALVGEWDTLYSRALGRSFAAHLNQSEGQEPNPRSTWAGTPEYFREFSYLRGLDGEGAAKKKKESDSAPAESPPDGEKAGAPKSETSTADLERAAGPSQYDYLRRLERNLLAWQSEIGAEPGLPRQEIGSIGVVGSDTYDKLLVLRALRKSFPRAVFFTTDLDASYLGAEELDHTRNLIVASSYDLVADWKLQGRIPPFRDSYQTALFVAVLEALGTRVGMPDHSFALPTKPSTIVPRVFEIGRNDYIDLAAVDVPTAVSARWVIHKGAGERLLDVFPLHLALVVPLLALVTGALVWYYLANYRPALQSDHPKIPLPTLTSSLVEFAWVSLLLVLLIVHVTCDSFLDPGGPSGFRLAIRFATAILFPTALYFLIRAFENHRKSGPKLRDDIIFLTPALCILVVLVAVVCIGLPDVSLLTSDEEDFVWFQGVSIWPTEIVRLLATILCIVFLIYCQRRLCGLQPWIKEKFHSVATAPKPTGAPPLPVGTPESEPAGKAPSARPAIVSPSLVAEKLWPLNLASAGTDKETSLLNHYCDAITSPSRFLRIYLSLALYLALFLPLVKAMGDPIVPARGVWSRALDSGILVASILSYCFLLFFVLDALLQCATLIRRLRHFIGKKSEMRERSTVHLINDLTEEVARLVYLPFSILFMLIAARNPLFDNWDWPVVLIAIFASGLILIFIASGLLQHQAKEARQEALDYLDTCIRQNLKSSDAHDDRDEARLPDAAGPIEWLKEQRDQIKAFDGVIFQPWYQNPIYRAMLIPLGGVGSLQLLEKASSFFH